MKPGIILRPLKKRDIVHIMKWVNDPDVVKNFQNFKGFTRKEESKFIRRIIASKNDFAFSIFRKSDGKYIGQCSINQISWPNKFGRFSVFIIKENWGNGFAEEAIGHLLHIAFSRLK